MSYSTRTVIITIAITTAINWLAMAAVHFFIVGEQAHDLGTPPGWSPSVVRAMRLANSEYVIADTESKVVLFSYPHDGDAQVVSVKKVGQAEWHAVIRDRRFSVSK